METAIISVLLSVVIFWLARFVKSVDNLTSKLETFSDIVIRHESEIENAKNKISNLERKIYNQ